LYKETNPKRGAKSKAVRKESLAANGEDAYVVIAVLNWNGWIETLACVDSLRNLDYSNFSIVVVDNGSTDESTQKLREHGSDFDLVTNTGNLGTTGGYNVCLEYAQEKGAAYILLLNNDTMVDRGALGAFVAAAENYPDAGVFGGMVFYYDKPDLIRCVGGSCTSSFNDFPLLGRDSTYSEGEWNKGRIVDWVVGCAMFIRLACVKQVGLFNTRFFMYREDTEWCLRAAKYGIESRYVPEAKIYHKIENSSKYVGSRLYKHYFNLRNRLLLTEELLETRVGKFKHYLYVLVKEFPIMLWEYGGSRAAGTRHKRGAVKLLAVRDYLLRRFGDAPAVVYGRHATKQRPRRVVMCAQTEFPHWSRHSGYHIFLEQLGSRFAVEHTWTRKGANRTGETRLRRVLVDMLHRYRFSRKSSKNHIWSELQLLRQARKLFKDGKEVVVHFMDGEYGYNVFALAAPWYLGRRAPVRTIVTFHQPPSILSDMILRPGRLRDVDRIVGVGSTQKALLDCWGGQATITMAHPVETGFFSPSKRREGKQVTCLTVGFWLRDYEILAEIMSLAPSNLFFKVVGNDPGLQCIRGKERVVCLSDIPDQQLLETYNSADIGLLPLKDSTANNSLLEMMACGLPIVVTDCGSVRDYVNESCSVPIPKQAGAERYVSALVGLAENFDRRKELGTKARHRAEELSVESISTQMAELYEGLFAEMKQSRDGI